VINRILFPMEIEFIVVPNVARGFIPAKYSELTVSLQGGYCRPTKRRGTRLGQSRTVSAKYEPVSKLRSSLLLNPLGCKYPATFFIHTSREIGPELFLSIPAAQPVSCCSLHRLVFLSDSPPPHDQFGQAFLRLAPLLGVT